MRRKLHITLVVAAVVALAVPAVSIAASGAPHAGRWKVGGGGHFTVSGDQKSVSGLSVSGKACGYKTVTVSGKQTLHLITEGGGGNWAVGTADPTRKNPADISGVVGQKVTIHTGGKTVQGRLSIVFAIGGFARDNSGDLLVKGCDIEFSVSP